MVRIRRCWAPSPKRPTVCNGYEREFVYVYGAVSPTEGELDWMTCRQMNTERMTAFLAQVSSAHATEFMMMMLDGASSHVSKDLVIPENIRLLPLPPHAPELNPQERVWDRYAKKNFLTACFMISPAWPASWKRGCPGSPPTTKVYVVSLTGLELSC